MSMLRSARTRRGLWKLVRTKSIMGYGNMSDLLQNITSSLSSKHLLYFQVSDSNNQSFFQQFVFFAQIFIR